MPSLRQVPIDDPSVETDVDTVLTPTQQTLVRQVCREYQQLDAQIKVLEAKRDAKKQRLGELRDEAGVISLMFEGFKVTLVGGVRKVLNKKRLFALGCKKEWLDQAYEEKTSKPYERVSLPGQKQHAYDGEED